MFETLKRLSYGEGSDKDIGLLEDLSSAMMLASMCGLGQAAPIPVMDTLHHFRDAYENRIKKTTWS
jgi:NADH:ubiquinone oxidoreductase subunit F (NADH-binding)